jgi:DnaJ-domain-containing protein 1
VTDDPFELLGLPARFDIKTKEIERAYLARAAAVHPDLAGGDDTPEQSAALNRAKAVLQEPELRANALLTRLGGPGKSEDKSLPGGFLMGIMETREAIEEALARGSQEERAKWKAWAQEQRGEYEGRVGALFKTLGDSRDATTLRAIRQELNAWRYIERLIEQLDPHYDPGQRDFAD